ncbi:F-box/LRR-repeat protein At3g03360-like [Rosa rugosa]|uniref:F-box/LRR-repeat protein At3g03360-like n=1 Tax=Rosa rugosa TaxID=74645 RepID=UPI002B411613|nr:F-box/LRR-repeat protein At3g03360-like [Rosa rugosa]
MTDSTLLPYLPDLVMHQIIQRLPTKPAIRMSCLSKQWEGVWSALRILEFDEGNQPHDDDDDDDDDNHTHAKFLNILARYLEFRQKDKQQPPLDKFRLCMTYLDADEDAIIGKLLSNLFERNVKDLDISLRSKHQKVESYYCLPRTAIINAKSVTTLNLEHLRIKDIHNIPEPMLPSLKTLSLKTMQVSGPALFYLILGCTSVEHLSLTSCSFDPPVFLISSSSLKSLEVKNCNLQHIRVDEAINLESFILVSEFSTLEGVLLDKSFKLSSMKIRDQHLSYFGLSECHDSLEATINTPNLVHFLFQGSIKSKVSLSAPNLQIAHILLKKEFSTFKGPWQHFDILRDFLEAFSCSKNITFFIRDFKDIIFPADFKRTFHPPFPSVEGVKVVILNPPTKETESSKLKVSLVWMAPSAVEIECDSLSEHRGLNM